MNLSDPYQWIEMVCKLSSRIGNTREQLFHAWMSFHFYENAENTDSYVTYVRKVVIFYAMGISSS